MSTERPPARSRFSSRTWWTRRACCNASARKVPSSSVARPLPPPPRSGRHARRQGSGEPRRWGHGRLRERTRGHPLCNCDAAGRQRHARPPSPSAGVWPPRTRKQPVGSRLKPSSNQRQSAWRRWVALEMAPALDRAAPSTGGWRPAGRPTLSTRIAFPNERWRCFASSPGAPAAARSARSWCSACRRSNDTCQPLPEDGRAWARPGDRLRAGPRPASAGLIAPASRLHSSRHGWRRPAHRKVTQFHGSCGLFTSAGWASPADSPDARGLGPVAPGGSSGHSRTRREGMKQRRRRRRLPMTSARPARRP